MTPCEEQKVTALDYVSCVLFCSSHAMTSSVIYYSTDARKNEIYLLITTGETEANFIYTSFIFKPFFLEVFKDHLLLITFYWFSLTKAFKRY